MALMSAALGSQKYLAPRVGTGPSWAVAGVLVLVGALLSVAAIRGIVEMFREKDEKAVDAPPRRRAGRARRRRSR